MIKHTQEQRKTDLNQSGLQRYRKKPDKIAQIIFQCGLSISKKINHLGT